MARQDRMAPSSEEHTQGMSLNRVHWLDDRITWPAQARRQAGGTGGAVEDVEEAELVADVVAAAAGVASAEIVATVSVKMVSFMSGKWCVV